MCVQLQKLRERMPSRGTAVTMVATLLEQCKVSSKPQPITIATVKKVDSHSNGSSDIFQPKKPAHSTDDIQNTNVVATKTCSMRDAEDNGVRYGVCEQMRSHLNQVNGNATIATCLTHICTTADVCDVRGVRNEPPLYSSDYHNEQLRNVESQNQQSSESVCVENASGDAPQPSSLKDTKPNLDFSNLKLRCMCSDADKFHSCVVADGPAVTEINDSETATTMNPPPPRCAQYHRCETPNCGKECYTIQRCCFCRQRIHNSDATSEAGQATASATNKSSNVRSHDEVAVCDSVQISQHSHSCSGECNLKLTLSTRNSDKICRCETEHCHNNQSYCDDGAIKNTCHCMRMCDFDVDRIDDGRQKLPDHTVIFTPDVSVSTTACGDVVAGGAITSTAARVCKKCDKSSHAVAVAVAATTAGHPFADRNDDENASAAETAPPTTTDTEHSAGASTSTTIAEDTSNAINNLTNEKRTKTTEKLVLDLNDRSKYTKEVSV